VSFLVACETKKAVDVLWNELSEGGSALLRLGEYPFGERYGWTQDRYGLSCPRVAMQHHVFNELREIVKLLSEEKSPLSWVEERTPEPPANSCEFESGHGTPKDFLSG
jgi:hypothetical protein